MSIKVVYFQRKPRKIGNFSIEIYFEQIRKNLPPHIIPQIFISKYESNGLLKRLYNTFEAFFHQGDINHITGDVHFLGLLFTKRKTVLTIHDLAFMEKPALKRIILKLFWVTLPVKKSRYITVVSEATKKELLKHVNIEPENIKVIYTCISESFSPHPSVFNKEKPVILQIGTAGNKNLPRLIEALHTIECTLVIVGFLSEEQTFLLKKYNISYKQYARLSEEDIIKQYINCDILAFISTYEGFGMPIIEANTVERVVLTSNLYSMPEVAGNAAHIIDPYLVDDIRNGVLKIIRDDAYRNELIENGKQNKLRFRPEHVASQYVKLYEELCP